MTGKLTGGLLSGAATAAIALSPAATSAQTNINFPDLCNVPATGIGACNGAASTNIGVISNSNSNTTSGTGAFIINVPTNTISQSATAINRSNVNTGGVVTHVGGGFVPSASLGVGGAANTGGASF